MAFTETTRATPNVGAGTNERKGVVLHHTAGAFNGAVSWLTDRASSASAHVVIARDGRRAVLAPDTAITWHAGKSEWRGRSGCNAFMLGVEFELTAQDVLAGAALTSAQIESCLEWLEPRMREYGWTVDDITDHRTVAVPRGRKADLSPANFELAMAAIRSRFAPAPAPIVRDTPAALEQTIIVPANTRKVVILFEE